MRRIIFYANFTLFSQTGWPACSPNGVPEKYAHEVTSIVRTIIYEMGGIDYG